jgi:predicted transcriptional regulator
MKQIQNIQGRITLYKLIWCKIRYWQSLHDVSDADLAECMAVGERTLRNYDKSAKEITLEKLDNFLMTNRLELHELLSM